MGYLIKLFYRLINNIDMITKLDLENLKSKLEKEIQRIESDVDKTNQREKDRIVNDAKSLIYSLEDLLINLESPKEVKKFDDY